MLVKVVDFAASRKKAPLADVLIDETLRDPGAVEVGHADDLRWSVALVEQDVEPDPGRALTGDSVFVVTGGAGSIVSAITADLARASGGASTCSTWCPSRMHPIRISSASCPTGMG